MAEEKKPGILQAATAFDVQLTGAAQGSHVHLLAAFKGGCWLLVLGTVGAYFTPAGWLLLAVGITLLSWSCVQWHRTRKEIDGGRHPGSLLVKAPGGGEVALTGDGALVHDPDAHRLLMNLLDRVVCQQPLPPPAGVVDGSPSDASALRPLSPEDAEAKAALLREQMEQNKGTLLEGIKKAGTDRVLESVTVAPALPAKRDKP